ncbi:MAG: family 16 glycosylhydrolase [Bacteroidales bacterium]|jgi:beta-glucanase (GH16 family)|nr:family 16 glycosylhydrolase [Bacteroidales bacterium]
MRKTFAIITLIAGIAGSITAQQGYTLIWQDEFDGSQLNEQVWNIEVNGDGGGNEELQYYRRENVSVGVEPASGENCLIITTRKEDFGGKTVTSGRLQTMSNMRFKYGKIEGRIKLPPTANGLWPAFWMMGDDFSEVGWPKCGEIDIMEMGHADGIAAGTQDRLFGGHFHWGESWPHPNWGMSRTNDYSLQDSFHLFTMIWDENAISMYLDNDTEPYVKMDIPQSGGTAEGQVGRYFHKPFFVLFNMAVGGNYPGIHNINEVTALNASNNYEAKMYVDYLRLYQRGDNGEEFYGPGTSASKMEDISVASRLQFKVYCANGVLSVKGDVLPARMILYSITGQKVLEADNANSANVSALRKGAYILKIQTKSGQEEIHKIILTN